MLHELDASNAAHLEPLPADSGAQDWAEVRLWRKVKRQVLVERRLAISAADRAAHKDIVRSGGS
jgi:hypothetical protein